MDTDIRWLQRLENLNKAFEQLDDACTQETYKNLELAGLVKMYELTFELCWKTLKDKLNEEGIDVKTPRETIKKAFQTALLDDADQWLETLKNRNEFSHIYNEKMANDAIVVIKETLKPMLQNCVNRLNESVKNDG